MIIKCIDVRKISGTKDKLLSEKIIEGNLDFVSLLNGTSLLLLTIAKLIIENEKARNENRFETVPLSKIDLQKRTVLALSKKETLSLLNLSPGKQYVITRKGWGKIWNHIIEKT